MKIGTMLAVKDVQSIQHLRTFLRNNIKGHFKEQGEQTMAIERFETMKMTHDVVYKLRNILDREDISRFSSQEQTAALKSALEET